MSPDEKIQFVSMQTDIQAIKQDLHGMDRKLDKVMTALMGSDVANDGGLVKRIQELEDQHEDILKKLSKIEIEKTKIELYQKILWAVAGSGAAIAFQLIASYLIKIKS